MKWALTLILMLAPIAASAASLPIKGDYCFEDMDVDAEGVGTEDVFCAPESSKGGNSYHLACVDEANNDAPVDGMDVMVKEDTAAHTLTFTNLNDGSKAITMKPCE